MTAHVKKGIEMRNGARNGERHDKRVRRRIEMQNGNEKEGR